MRPSPPPALLSVLLATVLATLLAGAAGAQEGANPSFTLANRGRQPINEFYATPAGMDRWGRDRLGPFSLSPGQTFPVRLPADGNCVYDLRVVYADGRPEERRQLNTCELEAVTFPGGRVGGRPAAVGQPASFRLVNRGRLPVQELYVSDPREESWGEDVLGDDVLAARGARSVRLPAQGCVFDVRVVFADGRATERRGVDLCGRELQVP